MSTWLWVLITAPPARSRLALLLDQADGLAAWPVGSRPVDPIANTLPQAETKQPGLSPSASCPLVGPTALPHNPPKPSRISEPSS